MYEVDNCLIMANADQKDDNADGIGDICQDCTGVKDVIAGSGYDFFQNSPNPFADKTTFRFAIPAESRVIMRIFDGTGQEVETLLDRNMIVGTHEIVWDADQFSEGIYFCTIFAESVATNDMAWKTIKLILSR